MEDISKTPKKKEKPVVQYIITLSTGTLVKTAALSALFTWFLLTLFPTLP